MRVERRACRCVFGLSSRLPARRTGAQRVLAGARPLKVRRKSPEPESPKGPALRFPTLTAGQAHEGHARPGVNPTGKKKSGRLPRKVADYLIPNGLRGQNSRVQRVALVWHYLDAVCLPSPP
jgi:hypothetical protein